MPENFSEREHEALSGRVFRCVGRLLEHMESLEVLPHRVRRIREPPVRERVRRKQVAELVVHLWHRHADDRSHRRDDAKCRDPRERNRKRAAARDAGKHPLHRAQTARPAMRREEREREEQRDADTVENNLRRSTAETGGKREIWKWHHAPLNETPRAVMRKSPRGRIRDLNRNDLAGTEARHKPWLRRGRRSHNAARDSALS